MCDFSSIFNWFLGTDAALLIGAGLVAAAVAANLTIIGSLGAVAVYFGAAASFGVAFWLIDNAADALASSACSSTACAAQYADALGKMRAVTASAGAMALAVTAAGLASGIPIVGASLMAATGAASITLGILLGLAVSAVRALQECLTAVPPPPATVVTEVVTWFVAVVLIAVGLTALVDGAQKARPESPVPKDIG